MFVLGIVGSPRKVGRTNTLVDATLKGAETAGVEVKKIHLVDYEIKAYTGLGSSSEAFNYCPTELSMLCEGAGAIILGAPVYWGDINGLTKDFMDTVRIDSSNGKPVLGIAIAGGTGKGLLSGIQNLYHFFFHRQMRAIETIPISRFNFEEALEELEKRGMNLAELSQDVKPFCGASMDDRWPNVLSHYVALSYFRCDPLDEFVILAEQLIKTSGAVRVDEARDALNKALDLITEGKRVEAAPHAFKAYQALYFPP
jgi:multimeric flavodoxin WrbA